MNHWPFILGSYALTVLGTPGVTAWSYAAMKRAERDAEALRRDR